MSEISVPRTPSPAKASRTPRSAPLVASAEIEDTTTVDSQYQLTPAPVSIELTPPPSTQAPKITKSTQMNNNRESSLASPPPTCKIAPPITQGRLFGEVPTIDAVEKMPEDQVRTLVAELLPALSEARMSAAHSKLQHNLLSIETSEATTRAKVEREMARREVHILQESPRALSHLMSPRSPQGSAQRHLELALKKCREVQNLNEHLEHRMRAARKLIRDLSGKNEDLAEEVHRLRQRIRENREHLNAMKASGAISVNGTPQTEFTTPAQHRTPKTPATARSSHAIPNPPGSQDAFDALLFAGQVLNEATSVPSTPTPAKGRKINQAHHIRGAHSLSSLPSTPNRSRPMTADNALLTPTTTTIQHSANARPNFSAPSTSSTYHNNNVQSPPSQKQQQREDRDSTISASEDDEAHHAPSHPKYVPVSQASQRATDMLRRSAMRSADTSPRSSQKAPVASMAGGQNKISGQVKKGRGEGAEKRVGSASVYEEVGRGPAAKKVKVGKAVEGLGIQVWDDCDL
ncbi:MAG: hypothetical protein Q9220_001108 [cf. Caloplaca sp. 1 TL-2023]